MSCIPCCAVQALSCLPCCAVQALSCLPCCAVYASLGDKPYRAAHALPCLPCCAAHALPCFALKSPAVLCFPDNMGQLIGLQIVLCMLCPAILQISCMYACTKVLLSETLTRSRNTHEPHSIMHSSSYELKLKVTERPCRPK